MREWWKKTPLWVKATTIAVGIFVLLLGVIVLRPAPIYADAPPSTAMSTPPEVASRAPEQVRAGRYLVMAGDCMACHSLQNAAPFSGGRPIRTPFGTVLSANLTPDETGLGGWSADDFYRALHEGVSRDGSHLYPAFPYNYYTRVTRSDSDAIFAYLRTIPPVRHEVRRNRMPFPFNLRFGVAFWNALFLQEGEYAPDPSQTAQWNRGAYLVEGLGHCGACHTPRNALGGADDERRFQGGRFNEWFAPDLTQNERTGLGSWSAAEIEAFLEHGRNAHASAAGEMGEVVAFSTANLSVEDRRAIVTYLTSLEPSPAHDAVEADAGVMRQGEAIFVDQCSACHVMSGEGAPGYFPPLRGSANAQQHDPTNTIRFILAGVRATPTDTRPTPLTMPPFDWKLSDEEVAAVATYVRNAWGNKARPVNAGEVRRLRRALERAEPARTPPANGTHGPNPHTLAGRDNLAAEK